MHMPLVTVGALLCLGVGLLPAQGIDTVLAGSRSLRSLALSPGTEREQSFRVVDGDQTPTSTTTRTIREESGAGGAVYVIRTDHMSLDGDTTVSVVVVRASDLSLLHQEVTAARDSAAVTATAGYLTGWVELPGEPIRLLDQVLERPVFPVEGQMPWLFPLLPLREGYRAVIAHFSPWDGGEVWDTIEVLGAESIEYGGRQVECWKVDGGELGPPGYRAFSWVEKGAGRILRSALLGPPGELEYWVFAVPH